MLTVGDKIPASTSRAAGPFDRQRTPNVRSRAVGDRHRLPSRRIIGVVPISVRGAGHRPHALLGAAPVAIALLLAALAASFL